MVVAHVGFGLVWQIIAIVSLSSASELVFPPQVQQEGDSHEDGYPQEGESDTEAGVVIRQLFAEVDVAGHDTSQVTDADLHSTSDPSLVVASEVIAQP